MTAEVVDPAKNENLLDQLNKFGRFQTLQYILICLSIIMISMMNVNYIFVAENVSFRCRVQECDSDNATVLTPSWWPEDLDPKCFKPAINLTEATESCYFESIVKLEECSDWIYEHNNSVISQLNIGCQSWKASLVGTVHNVGMIVSMILMGWLSDKFGRKPTIVLCSVGGCIGVIKIFITNFYLYLSIEFLEAFIASGLYAVGVVWMVEIGGETKRVACGVIFAYAIYTGEVLFAFLAMWLQFWKSIIIATYVPMALFAIYGIILRESIRWQMIRGRIAEAKATFKIIIKINKLCVNKDEIDNINENDLLSAFNVVAKKEKETIKDILGSKKIMIRLAVSSFCFFTASFIYYGLAVQSVLLPGDKYTNFILTSLASLPGDLLALYSFPKFGRKISLQIGFLACAAFLIAQTFTPDSLPWVKIILFLLGKLGVALCFTGMFTYSIELFPASVRGSLVGFGNTAARIGGVLSPLTPLLVTELSFLPMMLFASTAVAAAFLLYFTPETKAMPMFDTIEQVEAYKPKNVIAIEPIETYKPKNIT